MKKNFLPAIMCLILAFLLSGCNVTTGNNIANKYTIPGRETLFQVSTINALLAGSYDGEKTFAELKKQGDFGLGTIQGLDGEMIALDGKFYQIKVDGQVHPVSDLMKTPFAVVTFFKADESLLVEDGPVDFAVVRKSLDTLITNKKIFYAIRIDGEFESVKIRSVPAQQKPYRRLDEVIKCDQNIQQLKNVNGIMVGFWYPRYIGGINISGYHFHFITTDRKQGGHVLDCRLVKGKVEVDRTHKIHVELLTDKKFE